ncbi:MAG TPA: CDP-diacylglycerol--glycerol-3-phosphate 3-phosphatidyltransferase [Clostridia bacterium]|nr:CDP-diacylglycerol--glycerol-3-phosphate 3-phosphatidyltransferase [Clostridia bacterium]
MNWPNRLTLIRIGMIPAYLLLMTGDLPWMRIAAAAVFFVASLTDFLDGYIARKYNQITNMGKFLDPIADKLLVLSALVWLAYERSVSPWLVIVVMAREFVVSGLRLVAASKGDVLAAGTLGKIKTVSQMALVMALTLGIRPLVPPLSWAVGLITLWSGADYVYQNRHTLREV